MTHSVKLPNHGSAMAARPRKIMVADGPRGVRVPAGFRVYGIGDIHGRRDLLAALRQRILSDAESAGPGRRVVVYVGDYVDRGPESRGVIDLLVEEPLPGFESVYLLGNHEAFLLRFLEDESAGLLWMMNGGEATCRSYGIDPQTAPHVADRMPWLQAELRARIPLAHMAFLDGLVLSHEEGDYLFVHAGLRPGVPLRDQDPEDLIWIREPFLSSDQDHGKVVIHGHTPTSGPVLRRNRIGIDTGACFGGPLTAVVLEDDRQRFIQAG